jgi:hypothetical protein
MPQRFKTSIRYLIKETKQDIEQRQQDAATAQFMQIAEQLDGPTLDRSNDNQLGMMDGKQTLITNTGWYTP